MRNVMMTLVPVLMMGIIGCSGGDAPNSSEPNDTTDSTNSHQDSFAMPADSAASANLDDSSDADSGNPPTSENTTEFKLPNNLNDQPGAVEQIRKQEEGSQFKFPPAADTDQ